MIALTTLGTVTIGLILSLLGSTGTLLIIPVFVYLVGINIKIAIACSLAVVGSVSLVIGFMQLKSRNIDWFSVALFGVPSMVGTYYGAVISKLFPDVVQLSVFALLLLIAAILITRPLPSEHSDHERHTWQIVIDGLVIGIVTGLVGIGGSFLIIPALIVMGGLDRNKAIATSLFIVAIKSLSGFIKYIEVLAEQELYIDQKFLLQVTVVAILGSLLNQTFKHKLPKPWIRKSLAMSLFGISLAILILSGPSAIEQLS